MPSPKYSIFLAPLLFTLGATLLLYFCSDMLFMAQSRSLFMQGSLFWHDCMRQPGGALQWLSLALTQLFTYPWAGIIALLLIWGATWFSLRRVFPLPAAWQWLHIVPLTALLVSIIGLGYWVYYLKQPGYLFRHSLGILCVALLLIWRHRRWGWVMSFVSVCFYPLLGWYSVLALLLRLLRCLLYRQWVNGLLAAILVSIGPAALSHLYTNIRQDNVWSVGFPFVQSNQNFSWTLTATHFVVLAALCTLVILSFLFRNREAVQHRFVTRYTTPFLVAIMLVAAFIVRPNNHNLYAEMRITRHIERFEWKEVLDEIQKAPEGPTRQMIMAKNIALLHTNQLHDHLFRYPNFGPASVVTDSLEVHLAQTAASLFYFCHGLANDAIRWSIENSVEYGLTVYDLRVLALSALLNEETPVAAKYLDMLKLTWFNRGFVQRYYPLIHQPECIGEYPELRMLKELHDDQLEFLRGDDGNVEWQIYKAFSNQLGHYSENGQLLALSYSLLRKEPRLFWQHLQEYCQEHRQVPMQFQEAAYLFTQQPDIESPSTDSFRFDPSIAPRYQAFQQALQGYASRHLSRQETGQMLYKQFGHTYWWFQYFCINAKTY